MGLSLSIASLVLVLIMDLIKGKAFHAGALVLALAKIQDIFKKYSGKQNRVIFGYGVRR